MQILIIEDEQKIAGFLKRGLKEEGYAVDTASDGEEGLYKTDINSYDLIILDLMLPKIDGMEVCRRIREKNSNTPILLLTAKDSPGDKVAGLDTGADDYLTKPFAFSELLARIRALLRRGNKADPVILEIAGLKLDPAAKKVSFKNKKLRLTSREFSLLAYLMRHRGRVVSKTELLEHVWDINYEGMSNVVETYIKYLRQKLPGSGKKLIQTVRGSGYILQEA